MKKGFKIQSLEGLYLLVDLLFSCILFIVYGPTFQCLILVIVSALAGIASLVDIKTRIIPIWIPVTIFVIWILAILNISFLGNKLSLSVPCMLVGYFPNIYIGLQASIESLLSALVILAFLLLLNGLTKLVFKENVGIGGGDIKLFAVLSLFLGMQYAWINLLLSCVLGLVFNFIYKALKIGAKKETASFPFGPAIAVSTFLCFVLVGS